MKLPIINQEADEILEKFQNGLLEILGDNLIALYLGGSLALGGFEPESSDIDFLAVTGTPLGEEQRLPLTRLHQELDKVNRFGLEIEGPYVDVDSVKNFPAKERRYLKRRHSRENPLDWWEHRDNFLFELWIFREHGIVLHGPDPKSFIDPISTETLRKAAKSALTNCVHFWTPEKLQAESRYYLAFIAIKLARALHTLTYGTVATKVEAVAWARTNLPGPFEVFSFNLKPNPADRRPDPVLAREVLALIRSAVG